VLGEYGNRYTAGLQSQTLIIYDRLSTGHLDGVDAGPLGGSYSIGRCAPQPASSDARTQPTRARATLILYVAPGDVKDVVAGATSKVEQGNSICGVDTHDPRQDFFWIAHAKERPRLSG
jgi:hypothetical protein